jgi:hypothetical protein
MIFLNGAINGSGCSRIVDNRGVPWLQSTSITLQLLYRAPLTFFIPTLPTLMVISARLNCRCRVCFVVSSNSPVLRCHQIEFGHSRVESTPGMNLVTASDTASLISPISEKTTADGSGLNLSIYKPPESTLSCIFLYLFPTDSFLEHSYKCRDLLPSFLLLSLFLALRLIEGSP